MYEVGNRMLGVDDPELQHDGKPREMVDVEAAFGEVFVYLRWLGNACKRVTPESC